jgi:hypothetical protein
MSRIGPKDTTGVPTGDDVSGPAPQPAPEAPGDTPAGDGVEPARTHLPLLSTGASPTIGMDKRATLGVSTSALAQDSEALARSGEARAAYMKDAEAVYSTLPGYQAAALKPEVGIGSAAVVLALYFLLAYVLVVTITITETKTSGPPPPEPGPTTVKPGLGDI